jgi:hypothetical protein
MVIRLSVFSAGWWSFYLEIEGCSLDRHAQLFTRSEGNTGPGFHASRGWSFVFLAFGPLNYLKNYKLFLFN